MTPQAEEKIGHEIACLRLAQAKLAEGKRDTPKAAPALEGLAALDALVVVEIKKRNVDHIKPGRRGGVNDS